ncbi:hypothetical protein TIFTF001_033587 [Ficus carica]|uniref:NB-ARC domain-containing protein n=1 Tax=Ficus carica TaxID=3494 RepID=A0AA88J829_FICCA|nr:hypothetical protein TIFTF001_033587 [Ficus carica]
MVGMDSRIKEFEPYLNLGSEEVHMVGIWGTGGIGKTTLAEQVFKRFRGDFEARSIVYSVRETCEKETDGLNSLKKQIDEDLLSKKASMKVLIVLDDVENETQLEALVGKVGPGSRIIITTRDNGILERCGVKDIFEVKKLTCEESLKLFCRKAFKKCSPPPPFEELSNDFVRYADGLPLLLEVLGNCISYHSTESEYWIGELNRLRETPDQGVTKVLRFSYDKLDDQEREAFLDIACFFKGEDESRVKKIFESCNFHPDISLEVLVARSLISITGGKVWMHDLLQQMGWEIISKEKELGKRSRLWRHEDSLRVLQENMVRYILV